MGDFLRKVIGLLRMQLHFFANQRYLNDLERIEKYLMDDQEHALRAKNFVLTVGYSKSGKTTFVDRHNVLSTYFRLSTNTIHDYLNQAFFFLKDDNSITGHAYWERQFLTSLIRNNVLEKAFSQGFAVVNDSDNLSRKERAKRLRLAKRHGYRTHIVLIECNEKLLLDRLGKSDEELLKNGGKPTWVALYKDIQMARFEKVTVGEADRIIRFEPITTEQANKIGSFVSQIHLPDDILFD